MVIALIPMSLNAAIPRSSEGPSSTVPAQQSAPSTRTVNTNAKYGCRIEGGRVSLGTKVTRYDWEYKHGYTIYYSFQAECKGGYGFYYWRNGSKKEFKRVKVPTGAKPSAKKPKIPFKTPKGSPTISEGTSSGGYKTCTGTLQQGCKGTTVKTLQTNLNKYGKYGLVVDGLFGPKTESALIKFQTKEKMSRKDGVYDGATKKSLEGTVNNKYKPQVSYNTDKKTYEQGDKVIISVTGKDADNDKVKIRMHLTKPDGKSVISNWSATKKSGYTWKTGQGGYVMYDKKLVGGSGWKTLPLGKYSFKIEICDEHDSCRFGDIYTFTVVQASAEKPEKSNPNNPKEPKKKTLSEYINPSCY